MSRVRNQLVLVGLVLGLGACASISPPRSAEPAARQARLAVQNNFSENMALYVVNASGSSFRIGTIMSTSKSAVRVPERLLTQPGGVRLLARPIGPGTALMIPCGTIAPNSSVELVLDRSLPFSNCWVR